MQKVSRTKNRLPLKPNPENGISPFKAWGAIALIILFMVILRVRLLNIPLERDEGEYAYMGQLLLQGIPPYKIAYSMKLPGIYFVYAIIMAIFGQTTSAIHLGLMFANVITIIFLFLITKRVIDNRAAIITAIAFAVLSISPTSHGLAANAEHFVILFTLAGILCMLRAIDSGHLLMYFCSGLLLGFSILVKQHGGFFAAFAGLFIFFTWLRKRPLLIRALAPQAG
ncbi:MAG: glycosyltransferase family 39 protein, partial [Armatimonadota bacterium]|nr:glycosyltransferase family 39 protein [Armatimonadota bacterium]